MSGHPVDNIRWVDPKTLKANDYNPNVVAGPEMKLLQSNILKHGWIQPILVTDRGVIIDGFHRWSIAIKNGWQQVPVAILKLTEPERMLLTIRINRAKGSHVAFDMSGIIKTLVNDFSYTTKQIQDGIGASAQEVELLLQENVFTKLEIEKHSYSRSWVPR